MKLIDEKEVEEAAKVAAGFDRNKEIDYDEKYYNTHGCAKYDLFKQGAYFAEQKLQPMIVELIDYIDENQWNDNVTSLEKLEQFLKTKQR